MSFAGRFGLCDPASLRETNLMADLNQISGRIINTAIHIHSRLGPGLLESVYESILTYELNKRGLTVQRQVPVPIIYESLRFEEGFRADLIVDEAVLIELKSVEAISLVHCKQVLTYLKLLNCRLGLLINFNTPLLKDGIRRIANGA